MIIILGALFVYSMINTSYVLALVTLILIFTKGWDLYNTGPQRKSKLTLFTDFSKADLSRWFVFLAMLFLFKSLLSFNRLFEQPIDEEYILLLVAIISFVSAYYFKSIALISWSVIAAIVVLYTFGARWTDVANLRHSAILAVIALVSLIFYVIGQVHLSSQKFRKFSNVLVFLGLVIPILFSFLMSSKEIGQNAISGLTRGNLFLVSWQMTVVLALAGAGVLIAIVYAFSKKLLIRIEAINTVVLSLVFTSLVAMQAPEGGLSAGSNQATVWTVVFNLVLILQIFTLIVSGYIRKNSWYINLGALILFIFIMVRYTDWFFDSLDKSIFFTGMGLFLFFVGWLMERGRRVMINRMQTEPSKTIQN